MRIILKGILKNWSLNIWAGLKLLRIGSVVGVSEHDMKLWIQ
jgi:hypothetical protein